MVAFFLYCVIIFKIIFLKGKVMNKLNKSLLSFFVLSSIGLSAQAATDASELAKSKNCLACHAVDKKLVGPSYNEVKAKYAKDPKAVDKLAEKVMKGGSGVWGAIPMPANPQVSQEEAKKLVTWILGK